MNVGLWLYGWQRLTPWIFLKILWASDGGGVGRWDLSCPNFKPSSDQKLLLLLLCQNFDRDSCPNFKVNYRSATLSNVSIELACLIFYLRLVQIVVELGREWQGCVPEKTRQRIEPRLETWLSFYRTRLHDAMAFCYKISLFLANNLPTTSSNGFLVYHIALFGQQLADDFLLYFCVIQIVLVCVMISLFLANYLPTTSSFSSLPVAVSNRALKNVAISYQSESGRNFCKG